MRRGQSDPEGSEQDRWHTPAAPSGDRADGQARRFGDLDPRRDSERPSLVGDLVPGGLGTVSQCLESGDFGVVTAESGVADLVDELVLFVSARGDKYLVLVQQRLAPLDDKGLDQRRRQHLGGLRFGRSPANRYGIFDGVDANRHLGSVVAGGRQGRTGDTVGPQEVGFVVDRPRLVEFGRSLHRGRFGEHQSGAGLVANRCRQNHQRGQPDSSRDGTEQNRPTSGEGHRARLSSSSHLPGRPRPNEPRRRAAMVDSATSFRRSREGEHACEPGNSVPEVAVLHREIEVGGFELGDDLLERVALLG